ncbi:hypothetical protein pdam_00001792 [Pocillopora damicornis]|uniref:DNA/RNA non-specific endonuclease domain-containing protein n=1 Tax=Pocillopora damicornis TaxID=46731 RepID=A0A3M6TP17_POCDA|nr:hypothetical protein pdam_00001792 [Pocillopora damicornis]
MLAVKDIASFSIIFGLLVGAFSSKASHLEPLARCAKRGSSLPLGTPMEIDFTKTEGDAGPIRQRKTWSPRSAPYFVRNKRPEGLPNTHRGQEIQQLLPEEPQGTPPYFVSLFDPERNIPFYSAYKVTPQQAPFIGKLHRKDAKGWWRNPPGVPGLYGTYRKLTRREPLSKGHMNPTAINTFDINSLEATFTLTNAVPQYIASNSGPWKIFEANIRRYAKETCGSRARNGTLYLLTGTSEYDMEGIIADNGNVNVFHSEVFLDDVKLAIPRALWTAGCCVWRDSNHTKDNRAESFAVMTNNAKDSNCLNQTEMSVSQVEKHLTPRGWPLVNLFPGEESCRHTENDVRL